MYIKKIEDEKNGCFRKKREKKQEKEERPKEEQLQPGQTGKKKGKKVFSGNTSS